jgi:formamidopyrimidine-DNA glycosylase
MPEGPEAAYIVKTVESEFKNKVLEKVSFIKGRYKNHGLPPHAAEFCKDLPLKLESVYKKGKVIFFSFSNNWTIISRLGLTGWWYYPGHAPEWRKPDVNVSFQFANNTLSYMDQLSYGTLKFTKDPTEDMNKLGPDAMDSNTTWVVFYKRVVDIVEKRPTMPIEELLSDQKRLISGIGNYLTPRKISNAECERMKSQ